jgi:hypothetical protein
MTDDDCIGARDITRNCIEIRGNATENATAQRRSSDIRIKQNDMIVAANLEAGRPEPTNVDAGVSFGNEFVAGEFQIFRVHRDSYNPFRFP